MRNESGRPCLLPWFTPPCPLPVGFRPFTVFLLHPSLDRAFLRQPDVRSAPGRGGGNAAPAGLPGAGRRVDLPRRARRLAAARARAGRAGGAAAVVGGGPAGTAGQHPARRRGHQRAAGQGKPDVAQRVAARRCAHGPLRDYRGRQHAPARTARRGAARRAEGATGAGPQHRPGPDPPAPGAGCRQPRWRPRRPDGDRCGRPDGPDHRSEAAVFDRAAADRSGPRGAGDGGAQQRAPGGLRARAQRSAGTGRHPAQCRRQGRRPHRQFRAGRAFPRRLPGRHRRSAASGRKPCVLDRRRGPGRATRPRPRVPRLPRLPADEAASAPATGVAGQAAVGEGAAKPAAVAPAATTAPARVPAPASAGPAAAPAQEPRR